MLYSITFCSHSEVASDVVSGVFVRQAVLNNYAKFDYPELHCCQDSRLTAVGNVIFNNFITDFPSQVASDVESVVTVEDVGM